LLVADLSLFIEQSWLCAPRQWPTTPTDAHHFNPLGGATDPASLLAIAAK